MDLVQTAITLFLIIDPLGNIPIFITILKRFDQKKQRAIIIREMFFALMIMVLFLYFGSVILNSLNLSEEAVAIGGGLVLMIIAIRMIFPLRTSSVMSSDEDEDGEPFLVPLAIPLISGPSLLATLIIFSKQENKTDTLIAVVIAWFFSLLFLLSSPLLFKLMGNRGLKAVERLMGMILISVSVQMLLNAFLHIIKK